MTLNMNPPRGKRKKADPRSVSGTIRDLMEQKRLTQKQLAEQMGVTLIVLNRLLNGRKKYTEDIYVQLERIFDLQKGHFSKIDKAFRKTSLKITQYNKSQEIEYQIQKICTDKYSPFFLILTSSSFALVCKKISVTVKRSVETTFQSYDSEEKQVYFVNFILYWGDGIKYLDKNKIEHGGVEKMFDHDFGRIKIDHPDDIMIILDRIGK